MHEVSLVHALIEQVEQELRDHRQEGRVVRLVLGVGRLSGAMPDSLRFAFEVLAPGTIVEGAELEIEEPRPLVICGSCGHEETVEELIGQCPRCGSGNIHFEGGRELVLSSIEVESS